LSVAPAWWAWLRDRLRPARLQLREAQAEALSDALRALGATVTERSWQVAGATERTVFRVELGDHRARMICDSYRGPLLVGDQALVAAVDEQLSRRR
jgi:hypothetical protein